MSVVEPSNSWDAIPDGILGDEEFDNILSILDFPMESLDDNGFVADFDITKSHCLGPMMGLPMISDVKAETIPPFLPSAPIAEAEEQKPLSALVEPSGPRIIQPNKLPEGQESSVFQTQSPVSVLESSGGSSSSSKSVVPMRAPSNRLKRASSSLSPSTYLITNKNTRKNRLPVPEVENSLPDPNCLIITKRCTQCQVTETPQWREGPLGPSTLCNACGVLYRSERLAPDCRINTTKRCTHCQNTKTPQWREGPLGPKTLCNACGMRHRSGRLFPEYRPAGSPTFVPTLHSSSHKKVVEMRIKEKKPI